MLLPDEWRWLRATTWNGPVHFGVGGRERLLLYSTAIQTGLRAGELRSLTRGRLFLDAVRRSSFARPARPRIAATPASTSKPSWRPSYAVTSRPRRRSAGVRHA